MTAAINRQHGSVASPTPVRIVRARRITTLDGEADTQVLATVGERIAAVGEAAEAYTALPGAETVDLDDAHLVPGFHDAHCHPMDVANAALRLDLGAGAGTPRERLAARVAATEPGRWIVAHGYNPASDPEGRLDRTALDAITTRHPVLVIHFSFHMAVAGSAALMLTGLHDGSGPQTGGDLGRDATGRLDGWLYERTWFDQLYRASGEPALLPQEAPEAMLEPLADVFTAYHAAGITSVCDAVTSPAALRTYQHMRERGRLTMRVGALLWHRYADALRHAGLHAGFGDEWLRIVGVKIIMDGALAGGTCLCRDPYPAETGSDNGIQLLDENELADAVLALHAAGLRAGVHANGDLAVSQVLDAIEAARAAHPERRINHRIEHCSLVDEKLVQRIRAAEVTPVPFGAFVHGHGSKLRRYYGDARAERVSDHRSFLDAGVVVAGSSDHPAGPLEPLLALQTMVTRRTSEGDVLGADRVLTVREALGVYTAGSAHATGESHLKGRIAPGYLADFTVLGQDLFTTAPDALAAVSVRATWVGARQVWSNGDG
ncbi:amidohydrolase [Streptomyces sp. NEAU-YJ-81]|uniref:amidohydrolase n=1 Tax=Streptomyces sp. NEAU-YJ-81 TaxID=2820288 RepID=UPI001ABC8265|nr:amidohydrolase [Streptomyces sp. NEAU-YJ-81]MBO3682550.1 amidohydrolase [Streptomyces sp. NEAU-YJ-81]